MTIPAPPTPAVLPAPVRRAADAYLALLDDVAPGLVEGFYLHGSLAWGEWHPGRSDIDFVAVLPERPDAGQVDLLRTAAEHLSARHPRPFTDGIHLTAADLAAPPDRCPPVPHLLEWSFDPAGPGGSPVTWHELAERPVVLRGPRPAPAATAGPGDLPVHTDLPSLRACTHANLSSYWLPSLARLEAAMTDGREIPPERAVFLAEWFVLGTARLHHLLATSALTSKDGAGRHALAAFPDERREVAAEALRLRAALPPAPGSPYPGDPARLLRDTAAFARRTIEDALAIAP